VTAVELAALADDVRRDVPSLDAMLPDDHSSDRELLALSAAYVDRASRIAWGLTLFVPVAVTLVLLGVQAVTLWVPEFGWGSSYIEWGIRPWQWLLEIDSSGHAFFAICVAAIVASFARRHAGAKFARLVDGPDPVGVGRATLAQLEPWCIACWTTGLVAFCGFFATVLIFDVSDLVYYATWNELGRSDLRFSVAVHDVITSRIRDLWILVPSVVICASWIAWRPVVWLRTRFAVWSGVLVTWLAFAAALAIERYGDGPYIDPANALHTSIIAGGFLSLFVLVSSLALRRAGAK
jgi:hypothetical protein